jgi:hypothetical protein
MATKPDGDFELEIETDTETPVSDEGGKPEIDVEDDTPEEDRGREPMPKEVVEELEADELEEYSEKVKTRLKQMKKVWHDERREKEREAREKAEALSAAQRLLDENRRLKSTLSNGETSLLESYKQSAAYEAEAAKRAYREAYEAGDADKLVEAQEKLNEATYRINQLNSYRPTLQEAYPEVEQQSQQVQTPQLDRKTITWQERNTWYGTDAEMTASALGLHQKLINERGSQFAGTDEYWDAVDKTMRRRFPEYFGDEVVEKAAPRESKPSTVVAPASRSRSPKKIVLKQSQLAIAKKLGLTPEQYARELMKMEN